MLGPDLEVVSSFTDDDSMLADEVTEATGSIPTEREEGEEEEEEAVNNEEERVLSI